MKPRTLTPILALALLAILLIATPTVLAATTGTITASSPQFSGNARIAVTIADADIATAQSAPVVYVTIGTNTKYINDLMTRTAAGTWVVYIANESLVYKEIPWFTADTNTSSLVANSTSIIGLPSPEMGAYMFKSGTLHVSLQVTVYNGTYGQSNTSTVTIKLYNFAEGTYEKIDQITIDKSNNGTTIVQDYSINDVTPYIDPATGTMRIYLEVTYDASNVEVSGTVNATVEYKPVVNINGILVVVHADELDLIKNPAPFKWNALVDAGVLFADEWPWIVCLPITTDSLTVTYRDYTVEGAAYADIPVTIKYATYTATLDVGRDSVPANATLHIIVKDYDANKDPTAEDTMSITLAIKWINATGYPCNTTVPITLEETGPSTAEFKADLPLNGTIVNLMPGTTVSFEFTDNETSEAVKTTVSALVVDASVSAPATFKLSEKPEIKIVDADQNRDTENKDVIAGKVTLKLIVNGEEKKHIDLYPEESDVNTGEFVITIEPKIGTTSNITAEDNNTVIVTVKPGDSVKIYAAYNETKFGYLTRRVTGALTELTYATPSLAFKEATIPLSAERITLILTEPNLNDDPEAYDALSAVGSNITKAPIGVTVLEDCNVTAYFANGTEIGPVPLASVLLGSSISETGPNTGEFTIIIDVEALEKALKVDFKDLAGGKLVVTMKDLFTGEELKAEANIGGVKGELTVDREWLPIFYGKKVVVKVTIKDADLNSNPEAIENIKLDSSMLGIEIEYWNTTKQEINTTDITDKVLGGRDIWLSETGLNTGEYEFYLVYEMYENGTLKIGVGDNEKDASDHMYYIGFNVGENCSLLAYKGALKLVYKDPLGDVEVELPFEIHKATLIVEPSSAYLGDKLTITVVDPDANLKTYENDTVTVSITFTKITGVTDDGKLETEEVTRHLELTEVGENTGVFKAEITLGEEVEFTKGKEVMLVKPGSEVKVEYSDAAAKVYTKVEQITVGGEPTGKYGTIPYVKAEDLESTVDVKAHTTELKVEPETVSALGHFKVILYNPDLTYLYDDYKNTKLFQITLIASKLTGNELKDVQLEETNETGKFEAYIDLYLANANGEEVPLDNVVAAGDIRQSGMNTTTPATNRLGVAIGDTVMVYYTDTLANKIVSAELKTTASKAELTVEKSWCALGEPIHIILVDKDLEEIWEAGGHVTVTFTSTSWPLPKDVELLPVEDKPGTFEAYVKVVNETVPGDYEVFAKIGDTVKATYKDYTVEGIAPEDLGSKYEELAVEVKIGKPPVPYPIKVNVTEITPMKLGPEGTPVAVEKIVAGTPTLFKVPFENEATETVDYAAIIVVYKEGVPVYVGITTGKAAPGTGEVYVSWTPTEAGTYTVKIMIWKSDFSEALLKTPAELTVTVESA